MKYNIVIEPEAFEDLLRIKQYILKQDSIVKANIFLSELKTQIKTLDEMPQRCRKSYYTISSNTHDLIYKGYTIVFKIVDKKVHILTIFRQKNY
jgi:plasmid stabilization system protein ParE